MPDFVLLKTFNFILYVISNFGKATYPIIGRHLWTPLKCFFALSFTEDCENIHTKNLCYIWYRHSTTCNVKKHQINPKLSKYMEIIRNNKHTFPNILLIFVVFPLWNNIINSGGGGCCRNSLHRNKSGRFSLAPCQGIKDKKSCFERAVTSTDYLLQLACWATGCSIVLVLSGKECETNCTFASVSEGISLTLSFTV